jgi:hypothetical protein
MLKTILQYVQNKVGIFTIIFLYYSATGLLAGLLAYGAAFYTMPWITALQRKAIIPLFLIPYSVIGLYMAVAYLIKNKKNT